MDNNVSQNVAPKQEDDEIDILEILMFLKTATQKEPSRRFLRTSR